MTGRFFDEDTQLQYNRARWYDSAAGRWLSEDPIGFNAGDANLSRYVGNGTTNRNDPDGLDFIDVRGEFLGDKWANWQIEHDGYLYNANKDWWTLGYIKGGQIHLQDRWGGGTISLARAREAAARFWEDRPDISGLSWAVQRQYIQGVIDDIKKSESQRHIVRNPRSLTHKIYQQEALTNGPDHRSGPDRTGETLTSQGLTEDGFQRERVLREDVPLKARQLKHDVRDGLAREAAAACLSKAATPLVGIALKKGKGVVSDVLKKGSRKLKKSAGELFEESVQNTFRKKIIRQNEVLRDSTGKVIGEIDFETSEAIVEVGISLKKQLHSLAEIARKRGKRLDIIYGPTTSQGTLNFLRESLRACLLIP